MGESPYPHLSLGGGPSSSSSSIHEILHFEPLSKSTIK